jgi:hypothetical protein
VRRPFSAADRARTGCCLGVALGLAVLALPVTPARADDPPPAREAKTEFGIVPLVGGDTDYGVGVGQLSNIARLKPGVTPFAWRLESGAFISFKTEDKAGKTSLVNPYQDFYILLTVPHFLSQRLRLEVRPSFTRETTQRYYGLGNASIAPAQDVPSRDFYGRAHPTMSVRLRWDVFKALFWEFGINYTENWFMLDPQSTLANDMQAGSPEVRTLLGEARSHGVLLIENSLIFDTRDSEVAPQRGQFHQLKLRLSPHLGDHLPYRYAQVNLTNRFYFALVPDRLGLAVRTVVDVQWGDVPFYETARYEDTFAFGGGNGIRGIPGQRYYGRVKVFSTVELRARLFGFNLWGKPYILGGAAFVDAGRLWADTSYHPELDGTGLGLKYGVGAGLRIQSGKTFVIRLDAAWSPDARPVGAYLTSGHTF